MDVDLTELDTAAQSRRRGPRGCVELLIDQHPDRADLIVAANAHPATAPDVTRFLADSGIHNRPGTIHRHRREHCACRT